MPQFFVRLRLARWYDCCFLFPIVLSVFDANEQAKVDIGKAQLANRRAREDAAVRSLARKVEAFVFFTFRANVVLFFV